jgi:hypothetical protein
MAGVEYSLLVGGAVAALFAGFIDAVVGGGGLIQIPALFNALPHENCRRRFSGPTSSPASSVPATPPGATRDASRCPGERPCRPRWQRSPVRISAPWWWPGCRRLLRPLILLLLIGAAAYTFWRREFGARHRPQHTGRREFAMPCCRRCDRFLRRFLRAGDRQLPDLPLHPLLRLRFPARVGRVEAGQCRDQPRGAQLSFIPHGHILPLLAVLMALCNVLGSFLGTHLALRHGSGFVRKVFLCVVSVFIVKFAHDTFV